MHPDVKSKIALNIMCQKKYTMPDSHKIRISVFYMREHMELVYIPQKRVE